MRYLVMYGLDITFSELSHTSATFSLILQGLKTKTIAPNSQKISLEKMEFLVVSFIQPLTVAFPCSTTNRTSYSNLVIPDFLQ